jgi:hypothetical protein
MWKTALIAIFMQIGLCSFCVSTASAQDLKALDCTFNSGQQWYLSLHATGSKPGQGVAILCENSAGKGWRIVSGTFGINTTDSGQTELELQWPSGSTFQFLVKSDTMTFTRCSTAPALVGESMRIRAVMPPPANAMSTAARIANNTWNPPIGSDEWAIQQRVNQSYLRVLRKASLGWFD